MNKSKLVRDNIPDIVANKGENEVFYIAKDDDEYFQKLSEKIIEELEEILFASSSQLVEELADLMEVAITIAKFKNIFIEKLDINNTVDSEIKKIKIQLEKILDCIDYISKIEGISKNDIEKTRIDKKNIKGGFDKRVILILKNK